MNHEYQTSDFYVAAYLLASGVRLLRSDRSNPRRVVFVFSYNEGEQNLIEDFLFGRSKVDPRKLISAIKELKQLLHSDIC